MTQKYRFEAFLALVCLGFFLTQREVLLTASLDPDEIFSWNLATGSLAELFSEGLRHCQQYLYYLVLKVWSLIFPSNDYWIRMPSLLFGTGTIATLFYLSRKIFKEEHLFIQAILLYLYPQLVFYSGYARPYALLVLLTSVNLLFLYKRYFSDNFSKKDQHIFILSLAGILFTHHIGAIYVTSVLIGLIILRKKVGSKIELLPYQLFIIVYFVQFILQRKFLGQSVSWIEPMSLGKLPGFIFNNQLYFLFFILPLVSLGFVIKRKLKEQLTQKDQFLIFNVILMAFFFIGITLGSLFVTPLFTYRHFYILLPAIFSLSLFGLEDLKGIKSFVLILLLFFILGGGYRLSKREVESGGYADTKNFLRTLPKHVDIRTGFTCVQEVGDFKNFLKNYSKQYYNVDICKKYSTSFEDENIILIKLDSNKVFERPSNYSSVYQFSSFEVLKKN